MHQLELWSDAHFERWAADADAGQGQKVITATLNMDPWNNQCHDPYADMIIWTKTRIRAAFRLYTVFDRWVEFMMGLGIDKMINSIRSSPGITGSTTTTWRKETGLPWS